MKHAIYKQLPVEFRYDLLTTNEEAKIADTVVEDRGDW